MRLGSGEYCGEVLRRENTRCLLLTETRYGAGARLARHSHARPYLCLVRKGGYTETYNGSTRHMKPLMAAFHPAGEEHTETFHGGETRGFNVEFLPGSIADELPMPPEAEFRGGAVANLLVRLYDEFRRMDDASPLAIEGLVLQVMGELQRARFRAPGAVPPWLRTARELLADRFRDSVSMAEVAAEVAAHPVHLAAAFRKHFGCTAGEYVRKLRVEFAVRRLRASNAPLADIAAEAGFTDQSHFTRTFKRQLGVTPAQYRQTVRAS
ncbi:MAG: AraC family transcriptional regulator [Bryobacteraceae bacterium]|nr:AraC family transcriptional regulator [Bryobacteraceae bacterium]